MCLLVCLKGNFIVVHVIKFVVASSRKTITRSRWRRSDRVDTSSPSIPWTAALTSTVSSPSVRCPSPVLFYFSSRTVCIVLCSTINFASVISYKLFLSESLILSLKNIFLWSLFKIHRGDILICIIQSFYRALWC